MHEYKTSFPVYTHHGIELVPPDTVIDERLIGHLQKQQTDRRMYRIGKGAEFLRDIKGNLEKEVYSNILRDKETREDLYLRIQHISIPYCEWETLEYFKEKDPYTYRHLLTVLCLSLYINSQLRVRGNPHNPFSGSLTHDIGKCSIPLDILQKETPLTRQERRQIEHHTIAGYVLMRYFSDLPDVTDAIIARDHHENNRGDGYPTGRKSIDLNTQIVIVCDIYDALLSPRSYRKEVFSNRTALEELTARAMDGRILPDAVKVLIAGNRKKKTDWRECPISNESRGSYPRENNYGKIEGK